ncbi:Sec-independent protein translocase TatB [Microbacterium ulmi]|uniref:Sec-independent protein translocase TatB n=1 Tax=Microbacterium ulmi TaxID=179095 RepID=A0A7Y2PZP9_9MICO|nr:Sec-independent protein translocase TatB [Microbacterium ulmi]NII71405.1 sec-independent protein translocase protein TatB [Microbacterium ulmi]NNH04691.1 Sec-independent protein translocase TatB [Microbacterium ulmi]
MFLGLTWEKLLVLLVVAAFLVGPERLPRYAEGLARLVTRARDYLRSAKTRVQDELGEDFDDVDWRTLDPRRYDPRRIIREALLDDAPLPQTKPVSPGAPTAVAASAPAAQSFHPGEPAPFDSEAT